MLAVAQQFNCTPADVLAWDDDGSWFVTAVEILNNQNSDTKGVPLR